MSRVNLEDNLTRRQRHNSPTYGNADMTLTGDFTVKSDGPTIFFFNGGAVDRTITMPTRRIGGGQFYWIKNQGTTNNLNVVDDLGGAICTVIPSQTALIYSSTQRWSASLGLSTTTIPNTAFGGSIGAVPFAGAANLTSNDAKFHWDNTNFILNAPTISGGVGGTATLGLRPNAAASNKVTLLANGNVGVGTETNPQAPIVLSANVTTGIAMTGITLNLLSVIGSDGVNPIHNFLGFGGTPIMVFGHAGGTAALPSQALANDQLGAFGFAGYTNTNTFTANKARITGYALENFTGTANGTALTFEVTPLGSTTRNEIVRVTGVGVSIQPNASGTSPDSILTINANTGTTVTPQAFTALHLVGPDASTANISIDTFGSNALLISRRADGILSAKTALLANDAVIGINAQGWDGSTYGSLGAVTLIAAENFGPTNHGSAVTIRLAAIGTASVNELARFVGNSGLSIQPSGSGTNPDAPLTLNNNTGSVPVAVVAGTIIHAIGADGASVGATFDAFGTSNAILLGRLATGTRALPTATAANSPTWGIGGQGYDGVSAYATVSALDFVTLNQTSTTDHSGYVRFRTVASGSAGAPIEVLRINGSGGLGVGTANVGTDPGNGIVVANAFRVATTGTFSSANGLYLPASNTPTIASANGDIARCSTAASSVNYLTLTGGATGANTVGIGCNGTDATINLFFAAHGVGGFLQFGVADGSQASMRLQGPGSAGVVNGFVLVSALSGNAPIIQAADLTGTGNANIDLTLQPTGTGNLKLGNAGSFSANGAVATVLGSVGPTGSHTAVQKWLTVKDSGGTVLYIPCF